MRAAVVFWSRSGNTAKVARAIAETLSDNGVEVDYRRAEESADLDWFAYDLFCLGFPSYRWMPPGPVQRLLSEKFAEYSKDGRVLTNAPPVPGKHALIFCTFSGPHTGYDEAYPAGKHAAQYFAHLGLHVIGEWYIVGEYHSSLERSTQGRLGDIRGRPNADDLEQIREDTRALLARL